MPFLGHVYRVAPDRPPAPRKISRARRALEILQCHAGHKLQLVSVFPPVIPRYRFFMCVYTFVPFWGQVYRVAPDRPPAPRKISRARGIPEILA